MSSSLLDMKIRETCDRIFAEGVAEGGWLRERIRKHVRWAVQGFEPGFGFEQRQAFTATVAERIHEKAVKRRFRLFGVRLWDARYPMEWCEKHAEEIVANWLSEERIKFGDPRFDWADGRDIADEEMSYWEAA